MTRVDEAQKKYPSIPRDIVIKYDLQVTGVKPGGGLDRVNSFMRAFTQGSYHDRGLDSSLRAKVEQSEEKKQGQILRPPRELRLKTGVCVELRQKATSPYNIREESEGRFALYENDERVDDVYFLRLKPREGAEPVTSKGTPIGVLMALYPHCFYFNATRYCQYFSRGTECKFCNFNLVQQDARSAGLDVPITVDPDDVVEAYKIRSSEVRQLEGFLTMGGMLKAGQAVSIMAKFVEGLCSAAPNKPNLFTNAHLANRKELQRFKDAGLDSYGLQFEMMHPKFFAEICPGKAEHAAYEQWMETIQDAVDIYGAGNVEVIPNVPGVTLCYPNMHSNWQEVRDFHIDVNTTLVKMGVLPVWIPIWWAEGSPLFRDKSNMDKFPPSEYHLQVAVAHHRDMMEYGLYKKLNKLMICGLHCQVAYAGDIGMLTLTKDVGEWMSDVVPDEDNYVAKFIKAVKANEIITFAD